MRGLVKLLLCLSLSLPLVAWAIRLGDIQLESALNGPLKAHILVKDPENFKIEDFHVALASDRAFSQLEMDKPTYLDKLQFTIKAVEEGFLIEVTTQEPLGQPVVDFLLDFRWPDGRLLRRYTALLDLPSEHQADSTHKSVGVSVAESTTVAATPVNRVRRHVHAQVYHHKDVYGPTTGRDQLLYIARELRPDLSVSIAQTALAVYHANPDAFIDHNINQLKQGIILHAPTLAEAQAIDPQDAEQRVWSKRGHVLPKEYRSHVGSVIVNDGDDIFTVAQRIRPSEDVSVEQTAWALFQLNRRGFVHNNINGLRANQVLRVPSLQRIKQTADVEALHALEHQTKLWKETQVADLGVAHAPDQVAEATAVVAEQEIAKPAVADKPDNEQVAAKVPELPEQAPVQEQEVVLTTLTPDSEQQENVPAAPAAAPEAPAVVAQEEVAAVTGSAAELSPQPKEAVEEAAVVQQQASQEGVATATQPPQAEEVAAPQDIAMPETVERAAVDFDWYAILTLVLAICAAIGGLFWWRQRRLDMQYSNTESKAGVLRRYLENANALARSKFKLANKKETVHADEAVIAAEALVTAPGDSTTSKDQSLATEVSVAVPEAADQELAQATITQENVVADADIVEQVTDEDYLTGSDLSVDEEPAIDALEEALVYMAYERYAQAEACLQRALDRSPKREELKLGLLEVYARTAEVEKFADLERMLSPKLQTQRPELWDKLQELKIELTEGGHNQAAAQEPTSQSMEYETNSEVKKTRNRQGKQNAAQKTHAKGGDLVTDNAKVKEEAELVFAPLEFDLTAASDDSAGTGKAVTKVAAVKIELSDELDDGNSDLPDLDFEVSAQGSSESQLSLDDMTVDNEEADNLDAQLESAGMDFDAEIELAEAYIEIGDVDGARELLDDVVKRSSGNLQARAQELIEKINTQ